MKHASSSIETQERLLGLAPLALTNYRVRRYQGDDLCLPVSAFVDEDQERLRALYSYLQALMATLAADHARASIPRIEEFLRVSPPDEITDVARQFGTASYAAQPSPLLAKTIHDLRGGGLTPLIGQLQIAQLSAVTEATANVLYFLTRDHLKIMRNALVGLDDAKREEDLLPKIHSTNFIVEKWQGATLHGAGSEVRIEVECRVPTAISECCVEFGALDRILYNLINNACRHTVSDFIRLILLPVPDAGGENLRFVLVNPVSAADLAQLRSLQLGTLFKEGTSTTGSGYGLAIATEFVSHAYGLKSTEQAIEGGYLGAAIVDDDFAAWFHWPRVLED
jgi:signal transduction histidine kinase